MARGPRGSLSAAHESNRWLCGRSLEEIYAADRSRSRLPHAEKRVGDPAPFPSTRKTNQGARVGGLSQLCPVSDPEASAEASCFGILAGGSAQAALGVVQRGHRAADDRRARNLVATHQQSRGRTAEDSLPTPTA